MEIVATEWDKESRGTCFRHVLNKLNYVKHIVKFLHKTEYVGVAQRTKRIWDIMAINPNSNYIIHEEVEAIKL